jgi:hypothetical protein
MGESVVFSCFLRGPHACGGLQRQGVKQVGHCDIDRPVDAFVGETADVRRGKDPIAGQMRPLDRRLSIEHIEGRPGRVTSLDRGHECGNIDELVPGRVDDHNTGLREPESTRIDERPAISRRGTVQRDHVAQGKKLV